MKYKKQQPKLVTISVLTTITCISWVGFSVYQAWMKKPVIAVRADVMSVFSPQLDMDTLGDLKTKLEIDSETIDSYSQLIVVEPTPSEVVSEDINPIEETLELTPTPTPTPTLTPSIIPTEIP